MSENLKVRDRRNAGHFWADNEIIDDYGERLGIAAYSVYMFLCRHAHNRTGECIKRRSEIAKAFGISHDTVLRAVKTLVDLSLIAVEENPGHPNVFILLEVAKKPRIPDAIGVIHPTLIASPPDAPEGGGATHHKQDPTLIASPNKEERLLTRLNTNPGEISQEQDLKSLSLDVARAVVLELQISHGYRDENLLAIQEQAGFEIKSGSAPEKIIEDMSAARRECEKKTSDPGKIPGITKFFGDGKWRKWLPKKSDTDYSESLAMIAERRRKLAAFQAEKVGQQ